MENLYPRTVIDLIKLKSNVETLLGKAKENGVTISGVVKGVNALPEIIDTLVAGGLCSLSSSRLSQLEQVKNQHPEIETLMLRIPMLSELERMILCSDISLNTEITTLKAINDCCQKLNTTHDVILMVDLGDLREGFFEDEHLFEAAILVENNLKHVHLRGIGTNLGCYGSVQPDQTNLGRLTDLAAEIERRIERPLEIVSGGASTSVPLLLDGSLPEGINHLRIGDNLFLRDMENYFDYTFPEMHGDVFTIEAEIIEIKEKPSHPIGTITVDAFGNKAQYQDIGSHKRALLAIGRQDLGDLTKLVPYDSAIKLIGGSSDHAIIDITNSEKNYQIGDIVSFNIEYELLLYSTSSPYVYKKFIKGVS